VLNVVWRLQVPVDVVVLLLAVSVPEIVCPSEKLTRATTTRAAPRYFAVGPQIETKGVVFIERSSWQILAAVF
jgi:hypothetical protein